MKLELLKDNYLDQYMKTIQGYGIGKLFAAIPEKNEDVTGFDFYLASASTYSSNIEGNTVDFDTYFKSKTFGLDPEKKEIDEIDDLVEAYAFAQKNDISLDTILKAHAIYAKNIIDNKKEVGKIRKVKVGVGSNGKLVYLAIEPELTENELTKLVQDINMLQNMNLSIEETFYFAAMIHLVFVNIHPFVDGNGRGTRLLEKWFLSSKLGKRGWNIQSEKNYFLNRELYYKNLQLGGNYHVINYDLCLPFLLMLPESLKND